MNSSPKRKRSYSAAAVNDTGQRMGTADFCCPICFDLMDEPHVTKCGHTYCLQCITQALERKKCCPKCLSPADCVFPNFLLNDLIARHRQQLLDRKTEVCKRSSAGPAFAERHMNDIHTLLDQKSSQLAISDLNNLILTLRRKKQELEQTSAYVQNELLKEFLTQARQHKMDQMEQLTRELNQIERDVRRADEISAALSASASDVVTASAPSCCPVHCRVSGGDDDGEKGECLNSQSVTDTSLTKNSAAANSAHQKHHTSQSGSSGSGISNNHDHALINEPESTASPTHESTAAAIVSRGHSHYNLSEKKIKMMAYFDVLESCYLNTRSQSLPFALTCSPSTSSCTPSSSPSTMVTKSQCETTAIERKSDDDWQNLSEFSNTLNQFTSYNGLRPLATLCYTPDLFSGSSIVSSIEFDKENEYFAIAGVTKKIKLFDYCSVISAGASASDRNDMHYPLVEMECSSKISCVSWSSYIKSMMVSSDYEGSVVVWDAFTAQKLRVFQEHEKRCWSVDFNKVDTKLIASGSDDAKVKLWSTNVQHSVATLAAKANVCCVKFNPSQRYHLAFGSADHSVHYYDLRNAKTAISVFKGHEKAVSYVKFLNESQLVSASTDSQLKLWSLTENHCVESFRGHINEKNFVGLATSGDFIACGSENNSLYVYFRGVSRHMLSFHFDSPPAPAPASDSEAKVLPVDGKGKKEDDSGDFVSAVSWRTGTNVIAAANSQGLIKILELV